MTIPPETPAERNGVRRILLLILVGAIGGLFSGALGVGGGVIMVPLLLWLLQFDQRHAAATSLAAIIPSSIAGAIIYSVAGHTDLAVAALIALGGVGGSLVGTRLLRTLPLGWLRWGFIVLLLLIGVRMFFTIPVRGEGLDLDPWAAAGLIVVGIVIGVAAGLFGVGGGVLVVPILVALFGVSDLIAKGTSLLAVVPVSIVGSAANLRARLLKPLDGLVIGAAAVAASFGGAAIAFALPPVVSSMVFGVFVTIVAIQLAVRAIRQRRSAR